MAALDPNDTTQNAPSPWQPLAAHDLAETMRGLTAPWWIAGGWALDLFLGRQTRPHDDIDVVILRPDQLAVQRHLALWQLHIARRAPPQLAPWPPNAFLDWSSGIFDIWARRHEDDPWRFQLMLMETDGTHWIFRRDPRIRGPIDRLGWRTPDGIPILRPEIQLLYKAAPESQRPKDAADFAAVAPALPTGARRWLAHMLATHHGRSHPWIQFLHPSL